jgi:hypothetical protein
VKTDDLIHQLASGASTKQSSPMSQSLALPTILGWLFAVMIIVVFFGIRTDWASAQTAMAAKVLFVALLTAAALPLVMQLSRPTTRLDGRLLLALGPVVLSLVAATIVVAELPEGSRMTIWIGATVPACLYLIPILALPVTCALMWKVRRNYAPTRLALAGAAIGALAGGLAGMAYALYCTFDEPAYVLTWYTSAILISAVLGAVSGRWLLRW